MQETDAEYSKHVRELLRSLLSSPPVEAGPRGDWRNQRRDRRSAERSRRAAARR
jgi:hypothetical protein